MLIGGMGNDSLAGSGGDDTFVGGLGNDTFVGNGGTDRVVATADSDFLLTDATLHKGDRSLFPDSFAQKGPVPFLGAMYCLRSNRLG